MTERVLVTAYACDPDAGSEGGIGWNWVREIAQQFPCVLITRENNVARVEEAARELGLELTVVGFDLPRWARFWKRGGRGAVAYFYLWQLGLVRLARRLDRQYDFTLGHHVTFASSWIPSGLSFLSKPFVWGPLGRHPRIPLRLLRLRDWRLVLAELARSMVRTTLATVDPFVRVTARRADRILCLCREAERGLPRTDRERIQPFLAAGTHVPELSPNRFERRGGLRVLFTGRLVPLKGVELALEAFAGLAVHARDASLTFVGEGCERARLEARVLELGLEQRVTFLGRRSHAEALARMEHADVFLFPSFEGGGMVVVEAMARGAAVVCLDFGGPGEMVGEERGLRAPVLDSRTRTIDGLRCALERVERNEELRQRFARRGHAWVRDEVTWSAKGRRLPGLYAAARGRRAA